MAIQPQDWVDQVITKLALENFQGFQGENATFELAPITVILGPNASGKSSIGRALKVVSQSQNGAMTFSGNSIDLASFENTIFAQGKSDRREVSIKVYFDFQEQDFSQPLEGQEFGGGETVLRENTAVWNHEQNELVQRNVSPWLKLTAASMQDKANHPTFMAWTGFDLVDEVSDGGSFALGFETSQGDYGDKDYTGPDREAALMGIMDWLEGIFLRFVKSDVELENQYQKFMADPKLQIDRVLDVSDLMKKGLTPETIWVLVEWEAALLSTFRMQSAGFILPYTATELRAMPSYRLGFLRQLLHVTEQARTRLMSSLKFGEPVRKWNDRRAYRDLDSLPIVERVQQVKLGKINRWLADLTDDRYQLTTNIESNVTLDSSSTSQVTRVIDSYSGAVLSRKNVGTGLSQVIPVLEDLASGKGKIVILEQPELHLHPKAAANLADILIESVKTDGVEQIVVETHSENLLLRLQKRIRQGEIPHSFVRLIIVEPVPLKEGEIGALRGNQARNIEIKEDGSLASTLPLSFAGIRLDESY